MHGGLFKPAEFVAFLKCIEYAIAQYHTMIPVYPIFYLLEGDPRVELFGVGLTRKGCLWAMSPLLAFSEPPPCTPTTSAGNGWLCCHATKEAGKLSVRLERARDCFAPARNGTTGVKVPKVCHLRGIFPSWTGGSRASAGV